VLDDAVGVDWLAVALAADCHDVLQDAAGHLVVSWVRFLGAAHHSDLLGEVHQGHRLIIFFERAEDRHTSRHHLDAFLHVIRHFRF
jgi:hypothetical protein